MALKLNTRRTFPLTVCVPVIDEAGNETTGEFKATFKVLPSDQATADENKDKRLLDLVFVGCEGLELFDETGTSLQGADLLNAARADPPISNALFRTYQEAISKKAQPKT